MSDAVSVEAEQADSLRVTDRELVVSFYKEMLFYRWFEERVQVAYTQGKFSGFCHLHIGQEAVCVGVQRCLRETDYVISGYRSHTQAIAKGIPAVEVMAELYGKVSGCCKGKGGSMHMFSLARRFFGGHGIVGGQAPLAIGMAFRVNYGEDDDVVVCYLGDAALNQGQVMEAFNMAAVWGLPVLFVVENNRYGMGTDIRRVTKLEKLADRARGFGIDAAQVDGMDVLEVYRKTQEVVEGVRSQKKPFLLEALTYRYKGHSVSDPATYRTKEELQKYKQADPITKLGDELVQNKILSEEELKSLSAQARETMREIEKFADESDPPPLEEVFTDVYAHAPRTSTN